MAESAAQSSPEPPPHGLGGPSSMPPPALHLGPSVFLATAIVAALAMAVAAVNFPAAIPLLAPLAVVLVALSLWGAAKSEGRQAVADAVHLREERSRLAQDVVWLSDAARELRESQHQLEEARIKAETASQAKSRLLATVSHEFRTPLNGILGLAGLLLETSQTPDQETYARAIHSSGEALLALVDDMLDFSRIEAGRLDLRPVTTNLAAMAEEIAELLAARAYAKGIDIATDVSPDVPIVMVDGHRLRQVLLNLAGNGVKFTEHGGVSLSIERVGHPGGGAHIRFSVSDSGRGIAREDAARLFREFEQLDPGRARKFGGAGLGLAISRRLIQAMGGDIGVTARPGGGSVFSFELSLPIVRQPANNDAAATAGRSILVVAPDGAEPPVLASALTRAGGTARIAASVYDAAALVGAAAAAGQPYDLVLLDRQIGSDPVSSVKTLREAAGREIPVVALIEPGMRSEIAALRDAGVNAYLVRPVRRSSLLRIVADVAGAGRGFRADPADARAEPRPFGRRVPTGIHVLLAEDNEINALLAKTVLEGLGHTVEQVGDGAAAVAAATTGPTRFGLVLMDLHMPELDGLAAARAIRQHERQHGLPPARILAVTADVMPETRAAALGAGIDGVIEKPVTPAALRQALAAVALRPSVA